MTLIEQMNEMLGKKPMLPLKWVKQTVANSSDRPQLAELLASGRTPDYVRMAAGDRIKQL